MDSLVVRYMVIHYLVNTGKINNECESSFFFIVKWVNFRLYSYRNQTTAHQKLPIVLLKFCKEIVAGMAYLSGKKFVHRDLAARNILVSDKCKVSVSIISCYNRVSYGDH